MIKIQVKGIERIQEFLRTVQLGCKTMAQREVTKYLIGIEQTGETTGGVSHGLARYVPYRYVSIAQAGGFKSAKQRGYVMAMIREGKIDPGVPHRTGEMQRGWTYRESSGRYRITNETPYAPYVMGDTQQARMFKLIGWRRTAEVVQSNLAGAIRHANAKVKQWLREQKRK